MQRKFLKLVENTITRYSNGGILTGDRVKLVKNFKSKDSYGKLPDVVKDQLDALFADASNVVIVTNIKTDRPAAGPGNADNRSLDFSAEISRMIDSGRYDNQNKIVVPVDILEVIDEYPNRHSVPDGIKYDNKVQIKPVEREEDEQSLTRRTQQGDTLKVSNTTLPKINTKIPSSSATPSPAVTSYTAEYLKDLR